MEHQRGNPTHMQGYILVNQQETDHVSPQFHVVFDNEFPTVPLMRKGKIPQNFTDLVQRSA